jgi:hypothetical protein
VAKSKINLLMKATAIFLLNLLFASIGLADAKKNPISVDKRTVHIRMVERASRVELAKQKIELELNGRNHSYLLTMGNKLKGYSVSVISQPVSLDSKPGYLWLEAKLLDTSDNTVAFLTVTVPQEKQEKFDAGVGFTLPKDPKNQLVFMIDGSTQE